MKDLLSQIVCNLVNKPDEVTVTQEDCELEKVIVFHLHVNENDTGRIIGKGGRIINAIRVVMRAVGSKNSKKVLVKVD